MRPEGILIFRIAQLGDAVVSMPAIAAIREKHPRQPFVLLTDRHPEGSGFPSSWDLLGQVGWFDDVVQYSVDTGSVRKRLATMARTAWRLRTRRFERVYDLSPYRSERQLRRDDFFFRRMAGIAEICRPRPSAPPPGRAGSLPAMEPEWRRLMSVVAEPHGDRFAFRISDSGRTEAENALRAAGFGSGARMVAVAPGSKMPAKRWPVEWYRDVIESLMRDDSGLRFALVGGTGDAGLCESIRAADPSRIADFAGRLSVHGTAGVIGKCVAYLGNDTGSMHLAAILGKPCVALFSARDYPGKWNPYGAGHVVLRRDVDCAGCMLEECRERDNECLKRISTDEVIVAAHSILEGGA